jgi:hypothetical protein
MQNKYAEIPKFSQIVEYVTQATPTIINGELVYGVVINSVKLDELDLIQPAILDTVMAEIKMVAELKRAPDVVKTEPNVKPIPVEQLKVINEKLKLNGAVELVKDATWADFTVSVGKIEIADEKPIEDVPLGEIVK